MNSAISVVLLTFNSAGSIQRTLDALGEGFDDIRVVDSFSTDQTVEICRAYGCKVIQRAFSNYADQRNWAIDNLPGLRSWQLHVDADEELEPDLRRAILALNLEGAGNDGYIFGRKIVFLGRVLRYGGIDRTWHCRLFRSGRGRCEDRLYDQHFVCDGKVEVINAFMLDHQEDSLREWTQRHNRWSDLEAAEVAGPQLEGATVTPSLRGSPIQTKRYYKARYYEMPLFWRAVGYFFYRYCLRLGFLDGTPGLIYHVLQGLWFRFLVDAKIFELHIESTNTGPLMTSGSERPSSA